MLLGRIWARVGTITSNAYLTGETLRALRGREDCQVPPDRGFGDGVIFRRHGPEQSITGVAAKTRYCNERKSVDLDAAGFNGSTAIRALVAKYRGNTLVTDNGIEGAPRPSVGAAVKILLARP